MKASIPQIVFQTNIMKKFNYDGTHELLHVEYSDPYIDCNGYDKLEDAIYEWSDRKDASFLEYVDNTLMNEALQKADAEFFEDYPDPGDYFGWVSRKVKSYRIDSRVVSLRSEIYVDLHGTPETSTYEGVTFDTVTGKILELSDIITDVEIFRKETEKYLEKKINSSGENKMPSNYEETLTSIWVGKPLWYLDAEGITFIFNPDEEHPYKDTVYVTFPYKHFEKYFKDGYEKMGDICVAQATVRPFVNGVCTILTRSGKLQLATRLVNCCGDADISLTLHNRKTDVGVMDCIGKVYFLRLPTGREFLLLSADYSSFDSVTLLFEIVNGKVVLRSQLDGANLCTGSINSDKLTIDVDVQAFGDYSATMNYMIGEENGELTQMDDIFKIEGYDHPCYLLTVCHDIPVMIKETKTKLPVGSQVRIIGTDNKSIAYFRTEDTSTKGCISFQRLVLESECEEPIFVNGWPASFYFKSLPYIY